MEGKNLKLGYKHRKLKPKREGPFVITEVLGPLTYKLKLPKHWKIHDVFNEALLTPYVPPAFANQEQPGPPPAEMIDDEEEHVVEAVISSRIDGRGKKRSMRYLVKWKGYPESENSWEPEANLEHAAEAIEDYFKAHPRRKRI